MRIVWGTEDLPAGDRFAAWHEYANSTHVPTSIRSDHEHDFRATVLVTALGPVQVSRLTYPSVFVTRSEKMIRQSDPEMYMLTLNLRGRMGIGQAGRNSALGTRDLILYDTSRPFSGWATAEDGVCEVIQCQIPRSFIPMSPAEVDRRTAVGFATDSGAGALLAECLTRVPGQFLDTHPAVTMTLGSVVADLLTALLHEQTGSAIDWIGTGDQQTLMYAIRAHIDQHLADPHLSPTTIAAAHHLSVRSLQRLFHAHGNSVTDWIRTRRLERCRSDLDNPLLDHRPAYVIAAKWGFVSRTHFSRLFRATYGCTPNDYRHRRRESLVRVSGPAV